MARALVALAAFLLGALLGYFLHLAVSEQYAFLREAERLGPCIAEIAGDDPAPHGALDYCYQKIHHQNLLNEFTIRRHVFQNQHLSDIVLLWMVVSITLSGVVLAALQLYASFELSRASAQPALGVEEQTLEVEKGRIALKSSVTGLFILLISFAFFYVYLAIVYTIDVAKIHDVEAAGEPPVAAGRPLEGGGGVLEGGGAELEDGGVPEGGVLEGGVLEGGGVPEDGGGPPDPPD